MAVKNYGTSPLGKCYKTFHAKGFLKFFLLMNKNYILMLQRLKHSTVSKIKLFLLSKICSVYHFRATYKLIFALHNARNTKGGSIIVRLTSCLTGLESAVWQLTIFIFICKTGWSKLVKQEVNGTVILPPLVFPA